MGGNCDLLYTTPTPPLVSGWMGRVQDTQAVKYWLVEVWPLEGKGRKPGCKITVTPGAIYQALLGKAAIWSLLGHIRMDPRGGREEVGSPNSLCRADCLAWEDLYLF